MAPRRVGTLASRNVARQQGKPVAMTSTYMPRNSLAGRALDYIATALGWDRNSLTVQAEYDGLNAQHIIHIWLKNRQGVTFRISDHELTPAGRVIAQDVNREGMFPLPSDLAILRVLNNVESDDDADTRR